MKSSHISVCGLVGWNFIMGTCCIVAERSWDFSSTAFQLILTLVEISRILVSLWAHFYLVSLYNDWIHRVTRTFQILKGWHDAIRLIPCRAQQQQFSDALEALYFRGVGRNRSRHVRIWHRQKEMIGRTDWYLVILSSKTYVLRTNWLGVCRFD